MTTGSRARYRHSLDELWTELAALAELDGVAVQRASLALLDVNRQLAELVISENSDIEDRGAELEEQALQLLALQSPVAGDLRLVMSVFPLSAALVRMGGLARHVARLTRQRAPEAVVTDDTLRAIVTNMSEAAQSMAAGIATALTNRDAAAAIAVEQSDERMDDLYRQLFVATSNQRWPGTVDAAVDAALLGRFYERFADQTVDAARRIHFVITGLRRESA